MEMVPSQLVFKSTHPQSGHPKADLTLPLSLSSYSNHITHPWDRVTWSRVDCQSPRQYKTRRSFSCSERTLYVNACRPIHDAVEADNIATVRLLLCAGADITMKKYSGESVLHLAKSADMKRFIEGLLYT